MRTNVAVKTPAPVTHEGALAVRINAVQQLRRSVMACMLFEDTFYESGIEIAKRIHEEVAEVLKLKDGADIVGNIAYEARTKFKLRHAPLWLVIALIRNGSKEARSVVSGMIASTVQRPDEMAELIAMYWKEGKVSLSAQMKKGLAAAFSKFDRYALSKYANRDGSVKMRDVLFLVHAKPQNEEQAALWKDLAEGKLTAPDTWESKLSAGADKKETFSQLINEGNLGALALLRNLRNMQQAGVKDSTIREALEKMKTERVLPFRFITAARYAPSLEPSLETAMFRCLGDMPKLTGKTALVVDRSGSMDAKLSGKSEMTRWEAGVALAMLLREICEEVDVTVFSDHAKTVPPRRGFGLRDVMAQSMHAGGTNTQSALLHAARLGYARCIVITDEQSHQSIGNPLIGTKGYFINVASNQNGIGYGGWVHIDGFSEATLDFIKEYEAQE